MKGFVILHEHDQGDGEEGGDEGDEDGDDEDFPVGLAVGEAHDGEGGDDGAAVGEGVEAAGGESGDAVQDFWFDAHGEVAGGEGFHEDAEAAGCGTDDSGDHVD